MSESKSVPPDHPGVWFPPPLIYVLFFLAGLMLDRLVPLPRPPATLARALGALFVAASLALVAWTLPRFWSGGNTVVTIRPTVSLVVEGPFRFTRNPMYLSLVLLYAGVSLLLGLVWPLLLGPGLVWIVGEWCIGPEERYLERKFGDEYQRYRARIRRWI
ncbi:MAG TPA: isoprenylcysteine carboxylmethyltransferase family protein [Myxococcota bacterium]|nr:isoprenylcysteine carboxylmethyltransferase family protein [Myxococcota bacterium]